MTWKSRFCHGRRRDGEPCGNPSSDGRGGLCWSHRRQLEVLSRRIAEQGKRARENAVAGADHDTNVYRSERLWWWNCPCGEWAGPFRRRMDADEGAGRHDFPSSRAPSQTSAQRKGGAA